MGSPSWDVSSVADVPRCLRGSSAQCLSSGLCWSLQLLWMALKLEMKPSAQPYLLTVFLCVPCGCLPLHPAKTVTGQKLWISAWQCCLNGHHHFSHFYFFPVFSTLACFPPFLKFLFLPDPHPTAPPWLALSSSLFLCPQNKTTSQHQWLWHDLRVMRFFPPPYSFLLLGGAAQTCLGEKADHSCFSKGKGTQSDLEMLCAFLDNLHYTRA